MNFIDDRGRLWGRINIIDLVIVVVLLAGMGRVAYGRMGGQISPALMGRNVELEVEIVVSGVRQATVDVLVPGTVFYHGQTNDRLGTLMDIRVEPAVIVSQIDQGTVMEGVSSTRFDVYLTLKGTGRVTDNVILLGNQEVRVGTRLPVKSRMIAMTTTVMAIREPE